MPGVHMFVLMLEHGIHQLCSRDADSRRFPFLTAFDPSRAF